MTTRLPLASCSRQKTITRDELRSQLTSALSFAAEAEMFVDYVRQNRSARQLGQARQQQIRHSRKRNPGADYGRSYHDYAAQDHPVVGQP